MYERINTKLSFALLKQGKLTVIRWWRKLHLVLIRNRFSFTQNHFNRSWLWYRLGLFWARHLLVWRSAAIPTSRLSCTRRRRLIGWYSAGPRCRRWDSALRTYRNCTLRNHAASLQNRWCAAHTENPSDEIPKNVTSLFFRLRSRLSAQFEHRG